MSQALQELVLSLDVDFTVTINGRPALPLVPAAKDAVQALMDEARTQAEAVLNGTAIPAPTGHLVLRMRNAIARWDELAKAQSYRDKLELAGAGECVEAREAFWAAQEAFEDAFNILIHQFEKEYPNGNG